MKNRSGLITLDIPVPPKLIETFGYSGNARFVGFYWMSGQSVKFDDGQQSGDADLPTFTAYCDHGAIKPHLSEFEICQSLAGTKFWLILDRKNDRAYVTHADQAPLFLRDQHSSQKSMNREIEEARRDFERSVQRSVSTEENAATANLKGSGTQSQLVSRMLAFLDEWHNEFGPHFS